ncbi:COA5 factor, partial [Polypterus senegalus]
MPQYYEGKVEEQVACAGIKEDLKACLLQHDCILRVGCLRLFSLYFTISVALFLYLVDLFPYRWTTEHDSGEEKATDLNSYHGSNSTMRQLKQQPKYFNSELQ